MLDKNVVKIKDLNYVYYFKVMFAFRKHNPELIGSIYQKYFSDRRAY